MAAAHRERQLQEVVLGQLVREELARRVGELRAEEPQERQEQRLAARVVREAGVARAEQGQRVCARAASRRHEEPARDALGAAQRIQQI